MTPQAYLAPASRTAALPVAFDADGFLVDPECWNSTVAEGIACLEGIDELTAMHWTVIHLVRNRYFSIGALPVMRLVCRAAGLEARTAHHLFSSCRSLWRVAGLPNPGEEARAYMN